MEDKVELGGTVSSLVWTAVWTLGLVREPISSVLEESIWEQLRGKLRALDGEVWNAVRDSIRRESRNGE